MSPILSASASPVTFSFTDPTTGTTNGADTSPDDFARLSLSAQMAAIVAGGVNVQDNTSGQLLVGTPDHQALFTMAKGAVTRLDVPEGFETAPADMQAATFEGFTDAVKSAYLAYNGLPANATVGTGTAAFPAYLASATADPFVFLFGGRPDTALSDFETLSAAAKAALVTGYGEDGALLVGTPEAGEAVFTLGADGSVSAPLPEPAGFALRPSAMDAATFKSFTPDQTAMYLRLNGLGAGDTLGTPPFAAYPAASLRVPPSFLDAAGRVSTSLTSFDALSPALQRLAVGQAGGALLVGAPAQQAAFALDAGGSITRTAVPPGFALLPAAMDGTTFGAFTPQQKALYLALNGLASGATLGTGAAAFAAATAGQPASGSAVAPASMTGALWAAMTLQGQAAYLAANGLPGALTVPATSMGAAAYAALTPDQQDFLARANGLPAALNAAPGAMTAAGWSALKAVPGAAAAYARLHGLSSGVVLAPAALTANAYAALTADEQAFLARANGLRAELGTAPAAMTAGPWAALTGAGEGALYLQLHGLSSALTLAPPPASSAVTAAAWATLSPAEKAFFAAANGLPPALVLAPAAMTAAAWGTLAAAGQGSAWASLNSLNGAALGNAFALAPAAMTAAAFATLPDDQKALYLAVNGLALGATLGTGSATFAAHLSADRAAPVQFVGADGGVRTDADSFKALPQAVQAAEVQVLGTGGVLLVGTGLFVLGADGSVSAPLPAPAGFDLVPSGMDAATWASFTADQKALYLRLYALPVDARLGPAATPAYPAGSLATPPAFVDVHGQNSTALADFDALPLAIQAQVIRAKGRNGVLLVGAPAQQAAFALDAGGSITRTAVPPGFALLPAAMDGTTFGALTPQQKALYLALNGKMVTDTLGSGATAFSAYPASAFTTPPAATMVPPGYYNWSISTTDVGSFANISDYSYHVGQTDYVPDSVAAAPDVFAGKSVYIKLYGQNGTLLLGATGHQSLFVQSPTYKVGRVDVAPLFGLKPSAMTATAFATLPAAQQLLYIQYNGLTSAQAKAFCPPALIALAYGPAGSALQTVPAPAAITPAAWTSYTDDERTLYLAVNGLSVGAVLGATGSRFVAHLSSDYAVSVRFVAATGHVASDAASFKALSPAAQAADIQTLGTGGVLLVGTSVFVLGPDGTVSSRPAPATGFDLLPSAMDATAYGAFTADQTALYLRMNGLPVDARLGPAATPAYPAGSLATPPVFVNASGATSTSLVDFDALPATLQKQIIQAQAAGGVLLVGTPANQAAFSIDAAGDVARTAVPSGFALTPSAMDATTFASFTDAVKALYLVRNGTATTDALGAAPGFTAGPAFAASPGPDLAAAAFDALPTGAQAILAQAYGAATGAFRIAGSASPAYLVAGATAKPVPVPDGLDTPVSALTAPLWGSFTADQRTLYAALQGVPPAFTLAAAAMTSDRWATLSDAQRTSYLTANSFALPYAALGTGTSAFTAYPGSSWRTFTPASHASYDVSQTGPITLANFKQRQSSGNYSGVNGQSDEVRLAGQSHYDDGVALLVGLPGQQAVFFFSYATYRLAETDVAPAFGLLPGQMTATAFATLPAAQQLLYLKYNQLTAAQAAAFCPPGLLSLVYGGVGGVLRAPPDPAAMTADLWQSYTPSAQAAYAALQGWPRSFGLAPSAMDAAAFATLTPDQKAAYRAFNGLAADAIPGGSGTAPTAMTAAIWDGLTSAQKHIYLEAHGLSDSLLTPAGFMTTATYAAMVKAASPATTSPDLDFFYRANGLPSAFNTAPAAMTYAVWNGTTTFTDIQKTLYLGLHGLASNAASTPASMTPSAYAAMSDADRAFFLMANGDAMTVQVGGVATRFFTIAPAAMTADTFADSGVTDAQRADYLTLNGLSKVGPLGTPPFPAVISSLYAPKRSFDILTDVPQSNVSTAYTWPTDDRDLRDFQALPGFATAANTGGKYAYGRNNYVYQYGHPDPNNVAGGNSTQHENSWSLLVGPPGSQHFYTWTVSSNQATLLTVKDVAVSAAFGLLPANMDAATWATMSSAEQTSYKAYWHIAPNADGTLVANAMTLNDGEQIDGSLFPVGTGSQPFPTAAVGLPPAPYAPPGSPALSAADAAKPGNAEVGATAGQSFHAPAYGLAVGPDMLGSTAVQATANAIYAVEDGTDKTSQALVAALSTAGAAAYALAPSALAPNTFNTWSSQVQLAYLHKNAASAVGGVFEIGASAVDAQGNPVTAIHVFLGTPANASVPPRLYVAESLTKTAVAAMPYADQLKLSQIPGAETLMQNIGMTTDVDAVTTLLSQTYQYLNGNDVTTTPSTRVAGSDQMNNDDTNVFISELNLISAQLFGLPLPAAPKAGSGAAACDNNKTPLLSRQVLTGTQTGGSAVFSTNDIQTQLAALQTRFKRLCAFEQQAANKRKIDAAVQSTFQSTSDANKTQYENILVGGHTLPGYGEPDYDVGAAASCNVLAQQEATIAAAAFGAANLSATLKTSSGKDLDLPTLICLFELYANAGQQAIVKADTEEINAMNALLQFYAQAQQVVNACAADTKTHSDNRNFNQYTHAGGGETAAGGLNLPDGAGLTLMFNNVNGQTPARSAIEILYGVTRTVFDAVSDKDNTYWTTQASSLTSTVTQINQQSQTKMNDITSENKQADRYFDLANTALGKLSDTLQKIAGTG